MAKKYTKTKIDHSSRIKPTVTDRARTEFRFNFKFLEHNHNQFNLENVSHQNYTESLLGRLKEVSRNTFDELRRGCSRALRFHAIDWQETTLAGFGISNGGQYNDKAFQFSLTANEHGRVHGFVLNFEHHDVFYVVWLDPEHNLYP